MPDNIDNLSGGVRIVNLTVICHGSKLSKSFYNPSHDILEKEENNSFFSSLMINYDFTSGTFGPYWRSMASSDSILGLSTT